MKTIGLIGGMSWESTITYYRVINEVVKKELGGLHSAKCLLYSVDFHEIEAYQSAGEWEQSGLILAGAARRLEQAGADFLVICTNTMHKVASQIEAAINIPVLHIAEATAEALIGAGIDKVGLLGTKYTMTQGFYKQKLVEKGIEVIIPSPAEIESINAVIFEELCQGRILDKSRESYLGIIEALHDNGAQAVVLGCTEIGLLVQPEMTAVPLFDTTLIHAEKAARYALSE